MLRFARRCIEHPATVGETHLQHFCTAVCFGGSLLRLSFCCFVHALVPGLFEKTASRGITDLHRRMVSDRDRRPAADRELA